MYDRIFSYEFLFILSPIPSGLSIWNKTDLYNDKYSSLLYHHELDFDDMTNEFINSQSYNGHFGDSARYH